MEPRAAPGRGSGGNASVRSQPWRPKVSAPSAKVSPSRSPATSGAAGAEAAGLKSVNESVQGVED
eukprot:9604130-Alexandrium_andersonii.AAC.1